MLTVMRQLFATGMTWFSGQPAAQEATRGAQPLKWTRRALPAPTAFEWLAVLILAGMLAGISLPFRVSTHSTAARAARAPVRVSGDQPGGLSR